MHVGVDNAAQQGQLSRVGTIDTGSYIQDQPLLDQFTMEGVREADCEAQMILFTEQTQRNQLISTEHSVQGHTHVHKPAEPLGSGASLTFKFCLKCQACLQ